MIGTGGADPFADLDDDAIALAAAESASALTGFEAAPKPKAAPVAKPTPKPTPKPKAKAKKTRTIQRKKRPKLDCMTFSAHVEIEIAEKIVGYADDTGLKMREVFRDMWETFEKSRAGQGT